MGLQQVQPTLDTTRSTHTLLSTHSHNTSNPLHRDTPGHAPALAPLVTPCCVQPRPAWQRQVSLAPPPHSPQVGHPVTSLDLDPRHSNTLFIFFLLNIGGVYIAVPYSLLFFLALSFTTRISLISIRGRISDIFGYD